MHRSQRSHHVCDRFPVGSSIGFRSIPQYGCNVGCRLKFRKCSPRSRSAIQDAWVSRLVSESAVGKLKDGTHNAEFKPDFDAS
jgi:hypothetical protein